MRGVALGAALLLAAAAAPAQAPRQITLTDAVRLGAQNTPTMVRARQDVRVADAQQRQATAAFLPSLTTNLSTTKTGGSRVNQFGVPTPVASYFSSSLGLTASWDLFTGFRRGAQRRSTQAAGDQSDAALLRQEYETALATKRAFFDALAAAELVAVAETRLRRADEQLKLVSERLRLGATTRSDSLRSRVEYGNAQLQLIQARADLRNTQATLARTVGADGLVAPVPDTTLEARLGPLDTASLRRQALDAAPAVREADASVVAARAQRSVNTSTYLPTLSVQAGNTWASGDPSVSQPFGGRYASGWSLRLTASYPLFNNLTREYNVTTADANLVAAEARQRDARLLLDANLTGAFTALEAAAAKIDIARTSVAAAEEDLRMQRERYRLGASTIVEVLTSQVSLDQAQVDLVRARYDYLVARAQIEAYVGHGL